MLRRTRIDVSSDKLVAHHPDRMFSFVIAFLCALARSLIHSERGMFYKLIQKIACVSIVAHCFSTEKTPTSSGWRICEQYGGIIRRSILCSMQ